MNRIQVLPPAVAERIAAGEVIERPASVVKELVENSIDAGATEVQIALVDGGKQLIEILDNGHGMSPDDLRLCVQRHATSKLKTLADLEKIMSLGFRGEALPSIAAVSDLEILSRAKDSDLPQGTSNELRAATPGMTRTSTHDLKDDLKKVTFGHFLNSPHGTRIRASGLFSQVPARLKFLKSQAAEVSQVREWIERIALAHPSVGFKILSDGRTLLNLRGQSEAARVQAILSDSDSHPLIEASSDHVEFKVRMYWFQGLSIPSSKKLLQVINGRSVRDKLLQQAVMSSFRQALLPGQFPAVALFLDVSPELLDVNVHPTKTEVRFLNSRSIFHAVDKLIESSLTKHGAPAYASGAAPAAQWNSHGSAGGITGNSAFDSSRYFNGRAQNSSTSDVGGGFESQSRNALNLWTLAEQGAQEVSQNGAPVGNGFSDPDHAHQIPSTPYTSHPLTHTTYVGTLFGTYFIFDDKQEMVLVDQHAAHERIRYEKLKKRVLQRAEEASFGSQTLLVPEAVRFPGEHRAQLETRLTLLADLGFDSELFSEDTLLVRSVPAEWGTIDIPARLKSIVERLIAIEEPPTRKRELLWDENLFEKLASEACHSAIRAGDRVDTFQALEIVKQLFQCEHPWNCPHGRPTVVRVARGKLEEWFLRKV
jgi:DNA mismatch repair protein MutL